MQLSKMQLIFWLGICGLWVNSKPSIAQSITGNFSPFTLDPLAYATVRPASPAVATTRPSAAVSLGDLASEEMALEQSPYTPIDACACGCGIFDVGTESMLPQGTGLTVYFEYAYQDQNINWSGVKPASSADNDDKNIRTSFFTPGIQYMFNRSWGIQAELPLANRHFETTGGASGNDIVDQDWTTIGDMRVEAIYDGFFPDQSAGVTFGLKLPTGNFRHNDQYEDIDRDSEIGTGSTDVLLGGFYRNYLTKDQRLAWFAQINLDIPQLTQDQYRPGVEADGALGVYLNGINFGRVGVIPIVQVLDGLRGHDSGPNAAYPVASGYERVLLSPGVEIHIHPLMIYADVELPVYNHVTGNQLVGSNLCKIIVSYQF
jgi:hypothetical protein